MRKCCSLTPLRSHWYTPNSRVNTNCSLFLGKQTAVRLRGGTWGEMQQTNPNNCEMNCAHSVATLLWMIAVNALKRWKKSLEQSCCGFLHHLCSSCACKSHLKVSHNIFTAEGFLSHYVLHWANKCWSQCVYRPFCIKTMWSPHQTQRKPNETKRKYSKVASLVSNTVFAKNCLSSDVGNSHLCTV